MTPHLKRWLTGIVAVPLLFAVIVYGSKEVFLALVVLLSIGGIAEYGQLSFGDGLCIEKIEGYVAALILPFAAYAGGLEMVASWTGALFMCAFLIFLGDLKGPAFDMDRLYKVVFGMLYVPLMISHLVLLRNDERGVLWIFLMIVIAFAGDFTAFYVGRKLGRNKLMPHVSQGKTVEGAVGSVAGSVIGCLIFRSWFFPDLAVHHAIIMGLVGNMVGELGDLCESVLKRSAGVKDSGTIFPGHGGVLDRLDCILFIGPFICYYRWLTAG